MNTYRHWLPAIALIFLSLSGVFTWVVAKQGLQYAPPFAFAAERSVGGALALVVALKLLGKPLKFLASKEALAIGLTQVTGFMIFQTWALVEGGAGKTAVLIFTMPIWTLLLAWPILGERIRGKQWLAAASTLMGLMIVIEPWDMHGNFFSKFLGVMAAICWAGGTVLIKRLCSVTSVDLLTLTASQMIFGAMPLLVLSFVIPEHPTNWSLEYFGILAFMSIISTALCWWLWIYILDRVSAWEASLSVLGTPVVAILSSHIALDEDFKISEIAGILFIGGGLALLLLLSWLACRPSLKRENAEAGIQHPDR